MDVNKKRDMARSVLPSTRRHAAANGLAGVRRAHRRAVRQKLYSVVGSLTLEVVEDLDLGVLERYPEHLISEEVFWRREADKLGPLFRWAVCSTRDIRIEDRLSHIAAQLPNNLIGLHAISHLKWVRELCPED